MKFELSPEVQGLIEREMAFRGFATADDLVREALLALANADFSRMEAADIAATYPNIRGKIAIGLIQARAGDTSDGEEFFDELERDGL